MKINVPDVIVGYCFGLLAAQLMLAHKINKGAKKVANSASNFDTKCNQLDKKTEGNSHE